MEAGLRSTSTGGAGGQQDEQERERRASPPPRPAVGRRRAGQRRRRRADGRRLAAALRQGRRGGDLVPVAGRVAGRSRVGVAVAVAVACGRRGRWGRGVDLVEAGAMWLSDRCSRLPAVARPLARVVRRTARYSRPSCSRAVTKRAIDAVVRFPMSMSVERRSSSVRWTGRRDGLASARSHVELDLGPTFADRARSRHVGLRR